MSGHTPISLDGYNCLTFNETTYCIGYLPMRSQACLYLQTNAKIHALAYFKEENDAAAFCGWLMSLADAANRTVKR